MQGYDYGGGDGYGGVGRYDADGYGSGLRGSLEQGSGVGSPPCSTMAMAPPRRMTPMAPPHGLTAQTPFHKWSMAARLPSP
jgi:hypothetical protein